MELSPSDQRIKQLMEQCGHPNSMSLYQAFKQFEMEIRLDCQLGRGSAGVDLFSWAGRIEGDQERGGPARKTLDRAGRSQEA